MRTRSFLVLLAGALVTWAISPAWAGPGPVPDLPVPGVESGASSASLQASAAGEDLVGLFEIRKGECGGPGVSGGSYFRMYDPNGQPITNNDSPCSANKTFTPLVPGTDAGLSTTGYQPHPNPAFDTTGGGTNSKITQPQSFFGVKFSIATNQKDPQTNTNVIAPKITNDGGTLSGDLRAFAAAWSTTHFNQGSPKPDGTKPGGTTGPTGTYNAATGAYTLDWKSLIKSNEGRSPFENFLGQWHLEGTFKSGVTAPGVQAANTTSVKPGRASSGRPLATTGADLPIDLGAALLALGGGGLMLDALLGRRRKGASRAAPLHGPML